MKPKRTFSQTDLEGMLYRNTSLAAANPDLGKKTNPTPSSAKDGPKGKKRSEMNKLEKEFAMLLEMRKRNGEIERYDYEGITLRFPDGLRVTPDFVVFMPDKSITFIEVKGAFLHRHSLVSFKAARSFWPMFRFELHQRADGQWKQLY